MGTYADDTEVFYSVNVSKPNLLFVLDISGSMSTIVSTTPATSTNNTVIRTVAVSGDDGIQEGSGGTIITNGTSFTIDDNNGATSSTRFRFINIDIPQGANITDAYIQFEASSGDNQNAKFDIYSEAVDDAPATISNYFGGSYYGGQNSDRWNVNDSWSTGDRGADQRLDITDLTQDVIDRSGWAANNAIAYYVDSDTRKRSIYAFDHPTGSAPELYIEYDGGGTASVSKDRLQVMQESLRAVLEQAPDNVKVGLMNYGQESLVVGNNERYRHNAVSGIAFPVTDINAKARDIVPTATDVYGLPSYPTETITVREYIADIADTWNHTSYTPIVDALYEAALYFRGEKMHYGQNLPTLNGAHPSTYDGPVVTTNVTNTSGLGRVLATSPKYISPIESSCQENYIVLMTDGAPTYRDSGWNSQQGPFARIRGTLDGPQGTLASAITSCATAAGVGQQGNCGAEITEYLATTDNMPSPSVLVPNGQDGDQYIKTFTIGFGTGEGTDTESYLKSLATYDDGNSATDDDGYFLASSPEELAAAFADILDEVAAPKGTLASPGYSVNVKNGLEHEKDIFIPVFDRKNTSRWSGNLKKFKLVDVAGKRIIRGKNSLNATDELGNFTFDALDYWSTASNANPDGRDVQKGGVANLLDPVNRKIYSNLTGNSNVVLNSSANKLDLSNITNISNAVLGLASGATLDYRKKIVSFMRGWKNGVTDTTAIPPPEKRFHMGDMLHSEPLVVTYNAGTGATQTGKQQYIFAGTNEGYLHAIDAATGEEIFAFIPAELLSTLSEPLFLNAGTQRDHKYGIDGAITGDIIGGQDGVVDPNAGDQVIIYFGLRRGGSAYYALDVTIPTSPKLLWTKSDTDHASMGQSWSTPYVATVGDSSSNGKEVVIVSGGYDEDEDRDKNDGSGEVDDSTASVTANVGNDLFIFDAKLGTKIWSMTTAMRSQITSSIAGGIRPLDTNNNNLIDRIYFGDTGGNVWRLDLSEKIGDSSKPSNLTKLATLGGSGTDSRKFFNEPDIALMKLNGRSVYAVSIGSGFRAHPMDTVINDKFYVLIDDSPFKALDTTGAYPYTTITESSLAAINISTGGVVTQTNSIKDVNKRGWIINLPETGEKVLGDATAVDGNIVFTTLVPQVLSSGVGIDQCAAPVTFSRLYSIDILTGAPKWDFDEDGTPEPFTVPLTPEIIASVDKVYNTPEPESQVIGADGQPTGEFECMHTVDLRVGKKSSQVTGYNACRLDSVYWSDPENSGD